jgi:hypothetical protein
MSDATASSQQLSAVAPNPFQGISPNMPATVPKAQSRMEITLEQLENAAARLEVVMDRAQEQLRPITRIEDTEAGRPDRDPLPALAAHAGRIAGAVDRVEGVSDRLIELLGSLDV